MQTCLSDLPARLEMRHSCERQEDMMGSRWTKITLIAVVLVMSLQFPTGAWAQGKKPPSLAELAAYTGADRETRLLAGAKGEGKVVWYTSLAGSSYKELSRG